MANRYRIVWAPVAQHDLDDIVRYVARRTSVAAAVRFYSVSSGRIDTLSMLPERCRIVPELRRIGALGYRECICGSYRIVFRISRRIVKIVAVLDGRRDLDELLTERIARNPDER